MDEHPREVPKSGSEETPAPSNPSAAPRIPFARTAPAPQPHPRRVAVVGVHGVGYHAPGETANAMANLLLSLPAADHDSPRYFSSFKSAGIQVPLQRLAVYAPAEEDKPKTLIGRMFSFLQEESASFARTTLGYATGAPAGATRGFAGHEFMRTLLYRYQGGADGDAYVTARLEGERDATAPGAAADVHIYEVLWADLASPTNRFLSFLFALFQLMFHLGSLSRLAIDTGAARNSGWLWIAYRRIQRYAVRMLQIPIPLLKIILLIALYSSIPAVSPAIKDRPWFPIVMGAVAGLVLYFLVVRKGGRQVSSDILFWAIRPVLAAAVGAAIGSVVLIDPTKWCAIVADLECWISGAGLLWYVLSYYGEVRGGVGIVGWIFYGLALGAFLLCLLTNSAAPLVPEATLRVAEGIIAALRISWIVLVFLAFVAAILGALAWRSVQDPDDRAKARAAVRTSRFALAIPSLMFLLITSLIWASLFALARRVQDPFLEIKSAQKSDSPLKPPDRKWPDFILLDPNEPAERAEKENCSPDAVCAHARIQWRDKTDIKQCAPESGGCDEKIAEVRFFDPAKKDYLEGVLAWSVTPGFPVLLGLAAAGFFLLIWWALPSVLTETYPLRGEKKPPRWFTNGESVKLGSWISRGLDCTSLVVLLIWTAIFVAPLYFLYPPWLLHRLSSATASIVGYFIGATAAAGILAALVKYSSPILGVVLDVDNYLRTSPPEATPRAKIVERYVSLLRYLARYRNPCDGRGYDSVVIVAHSLGSLISTDLLRFLYAEGDAALAPLGLAGEFEQDQGGISLKLLTMGNPTRQLLNRFFPYLYDWVRESPDNGAHPLPPPVAPPPPPTIPPDALPDPAELGLTTWVNTYRSGDYVGRSLWLTEWYRRTTGANDTGAYPLAIYEAGSDGRLEMCIGAGAHTHYWDDTAPDVAEQLNTLI